MAKQAALEPLSAIDFEPFDDHAVLASSIKVTNAGDGLSRAVQVDPVELHKGQEVFVVLQTTVDKIGFEEIDETDAWRRVHTLRAEGATIVDKDIVNAHLEAQAERIRLAREKAAGIQRLPGTNGDEPSDDNVDDALEALAKRKSQTFTAAALESIAEDLDVKIRKGAPKLEMAIAILAVDPGALSDKGTAEDAS